MPSNPAPPRLALLAGILGLYLLIGSLYAGKTPAWQVPDEPAHYNYIAHIAATGSLPVLQAGDYDGPYLERLKAERFPPELSIASIRYESWQPPLYYVLTAPVFAATGGSLLAVRLFTLVLGSGVIVLTYLLARLVVPQASSVALAAAGFVAFLPQHVAMLAAANNDALAEVMVALGLLLGARALLSPVGAPARRFWLLGVVLGLAFLTKLSAYPLAALLGLVLLLLARREHWSIPTLLRAGLALYVPAVLIGLLLWGRNLAVYGGLDFLAMQRHDQVVQGQLRLAEGLALWGAGGYVNRFVTTTFRSFWGQFGWMGVVMDSRVYLALLLFTLVLVIGAAGALAHVWRSRARWPRPQRDVALLLSASVLLTVVVYLYYNLSFVQFQGRYLYTALPVIALGAGLALRQWACWLLASLSLPRAWSEPAQRLLPLVPIGCMALLAVFALYRFIVPQLAG